MRLLSDGSEGHGCLWFLVEASLPPWMCLHSARNSGWFSCTFVAGLSCLECS